MKLQFFILSVWSYFVLANQEGGYQLMMTESPYIDVASFADQFNYSYPEYENGPESSPCNETVPGFNSLGLLITFIIVFVFSMVGNSVVVYVLCYMEKRRSNTDIYLMHLALADLLFSLTLPLWAISEHSGWIFGTFLCKIMSGCQEAAVYSGVFLLACISVDRCFAIVRATRALASHHLLVKVVCSVVWVVAVLLSLPVVIQKQSMQANDLGQEICHENLTGESINRWRVSVRVLRHTVGFFLPLVVMAVCYSWTVLTLFHTRNQQKHKAIRVILAVVFAFVLCWLPYNIIVLIDTLMKGGPIKVLSCDTRYRVEVALYVTQVLAFSHCAVNPVLYAFIGQKFRNQLLSALYKHGLISKRIQMAYRKGSSNSFGSTRSRITSATM